MNKHLAQERKTQLNNVSIKLKKKFQGIDDVIDDVIDHITFWYCYPELLMRPTIVNLWGLTGVGKTDLVNRIVQYLRIEKFASLDSSRFFISEPISLENTISELRVYTDEPFVVLIDEFQKNSDIKNDVKDHAMNEIWRFFSDGKFFNVNTLLKRISGTALSVSNIDYNYIPYYGDAEPSSAESIRKSKKTSLTRILKYSGIMSSIVDSMTLDERQKMISDATMLALSNQSIYSPQFVANIIKKRYTTESLGTMIDEILVELGAFYTSTFLKDRHDKIRKIYNSETFDEESLTYSKALIFICGNLNDVFLPSPQDNVDTTDIDQLHEFSQTIDRNEVLNGLAKLFTPEKVSRLGYKHVIYPSLSRDGYSQVIDSELTQISIRCWNKYGVKIILTQDKALFDHIFDSIDAKQGVRPVLSHIHQITGQFLPNLILKMKNRELDDQLTSDQVYIVKNYAALKV